MKQRTAFEEQVDDVVRKYFLDQEPTEEEVRAFYERTFDGMAGFLPGAPQDREASIDSMVEQYCSELAITKKIGFAFVDEETKPWLRDAEEDILENRGGWYYWERYKKYLISDKRWSPAAVRSVDKDTYAILDNMADPKPEVHFERRGLVVASVQSGKTANYIGLITRAADVGYKIIIVMAGVYNVLRSQTQARIEEGFVGFNIVNNQREPVGVGLESNPRPPVVGTTRDKDFSKNRADTLMGIQSRQFDDPILFVIKKNSSSLKNVLEWLKSNASPEDPLLLIDDEADNASINVRYKRDKRDDEPTRINGQIRSILNYFDRKCYVGYTATPYANILIDPYIDTKEYKKDLFPKSFIYTLEESSDYFGATKVFDDYDSDHPEHLRYIYDIDDILPAKHGSGTRVDTIPESMKEAIRTFIVATAIRTLRGDGDEHSTMMINVSPYTAPQESVEVLVEEYLKELQNSILVYAQLSTDMALRASSNLRDLHDTWKREYSHLADGLGWREVQHALRDATKFMHVVSINTRSNDVLDYEHQTEHVIAVGGYRLSRGLTLEGLVVSYYSRNAKAYDALMQMARWFGYRPGYEDLCRIWMSEKAAGWYKFVADSTDDLFDELRDMRQVNRTPQNYGLKIRQSPDSLIVTARTKMGTGEKGEAPIDLNNGFVETIAFERDAETISSNKAAVQVLLERIKRCPSCMREGEYLFRRVPVEYIEKFLNEYTNEDAYSPKSQKAPVLDYINDRKIDGELNIWDVYIAHGNGDEVCLSSSVSVPYEIRYPGSNTNDTCLVVGEKNRLSSRGIEKEGLSEKQVKKAKEDFDRDHYRENDKKKNPSDIYYRRYRKTPLLVIHPVSMGFSIDSEESREKAKLARWPSIDHREEAYGWSISFPYTDKQTKPVAYVYNQVAIKNIKLEFEEDTDDDYADDSEY